MALLGVPLTWAAAAGLVWLDLSSSNRPHELRFVPWVGALAALSVGLSALAARGLLRASRGNGPDRWRARAGLVLACCGMVPGLFLLGLAVVGLVRS